MLPAACQQTHAADAATVGGAVEGKRLVVALAQSGRSIVGTGVCLHSGHQGSAPLQRLHVVRQLTETDVLQRFRPLGEGEPARGAGEGGRGCLPVPVLMDALLAEAVPARQGQRVGEHLQADAALQVAPQLPDGVVRFHVVAVR